MIKKPEPGEGNATMQIDAVGDLEGVQLDDNEASDAPASVPPPSIGRAMPPPIPAFAAAAPAPAAPPRPSAPPAKSSRSPLIYGAIFVVVAIGITAGVKLGSALRGPAPLASGPSSGAPSSAPTEAPGSAPSPSSAASAAPSSASSVMRLDTIEVRDPPAETK
jgi:hypothetical protein